jgi:hypothetical protein
MASSPISNEMLNYFMQLNEAEKQSVLELIKTFLTNRPNQSQPQSMEEYNQELQDADSEIESGEFILHEEVVKRYAKK